MVCGWFCVLFVLLFFFSSSINFPLYENSFSNDISNYFSCLFLYMYLFSL